MKRGTVGQLLLSDILPADVYDGQPLTKGNLSKVMESVAKRYPDQYEDISFKLVQLGLRAGESFGGLSFDESHFSPTPRSLAREAKLRRAVTQILRETPDDKERRRKISELLDSESDAQTSEILEDSIAEGNPFATQLNGAGRGSPGALASMRGGNIAVADAAGNTVPIPITRGYGDGVTPMQYLGLSYGARRGISTTKLAVGQSGFLSKLLQQAAHRLMVTDLDDDSHVSQRPRGLEVPVEDQSNVGALLAIDQGPFKRNTVITPKILAQLRAEGRDTILVRSPMAASNREGGVYARDIGLREDGELATIGEAAGLAASQAIGEIAQQTSLSAKHSGGRKSKSSTNQPGLQGFELIEKLTNLSEGTRGVSAHAMRDGVVRDIREAPQGGRYIDIDDEPHYVAAGFDPIVKVGQSVEAGLPISNGVPNPAIVARLRGVGEGRKYLVDALRMATKGEIDRRQLELLSTGLLDRVKFTQEYGEFLPDSVVPYSRVESLYEPREDAEQLDPVSARGYYLEEPVLHYSLGTRITPSIAAKIKAYSPTVMVHKQPPPFEPHVSRGLDLLTTDPDWMTRFLGSNLKKGFQSAVYFGAESDTHGTSFVPSRASAVEFGRTPLQQGDR